MQWGKSNMKHRRITSALTAAMCTAVMLSVMPAPAAVQAETIVSNDFEINYDGWHGNADAVLLTASDFAGWNNTRGMIVSGRTAATDGAASSKGLYLTGGAEYDYSVQVYSETAEHFRLTLLVRDEKTDKETVTELVSQDVAAGEWTTLSASHKAPAGSYEFQLTVTADSTNDFSFDAVTITGKKASNTVSAATTEKGLKDEFAKYFRIGNILNGTTVKNSAITANIQGAVAQNILHRGVNNGIAFRGHTLVWHSQTPEWAFKEGFNASNTWVSQSTMDARMESYIRNMFNAIATQYPSLNLYAYDVCNECVSDDSNRTANYGGAREAGTGNGQSKWVQIYGSNSFVEKAFTYARKYAPEGCKLYYNDYNEYWDHKRDCIYNMCKSLYEKGLLDGVGMQSHVPANATGFAGTDSYITAMKKYLSIGCDVQITELDISLLNNGTPTYSLQDQATKYKAIFQAAMDWNDNPQSTGRVTLIQMWGPNDANSWLPSGSNALLYDSGNQPKLAYTTLTSMIPTSEWGDGTQYDGGSGSIAEPDENGWYFHSTFEGTTDGWSARGAADILTSGRTSYAGSESLLVENRTAAWNGAYRPLSTAAFKPGETYSFSANVTYFDGGSTDTFYMKLQYTDANGDTQYSTVAEATGVKGEWVQLANTNYTIPSDASNMQLYLETADTTNNFYIDEAIGAVAGTVISGAGQAGTVLLGDVDCDGKITAKDLTAMKRGLANGFSGTIAKLNADVDQSGTTDLSDAVLLFRYLLTIIQEFPVAEKVIDYDAMEKVFASVSVASSYKKDTEGNPLYTQRFGADPGVMEYNGRVYVYMTNDVIEYDSSGNVVENTYGQVNKINCISSDDMVNWTDHGAIPVAGSSGIAKWASLSWAPCAAHKTINGKEKFFLYFCNGGNGVSVLTADSPTGPWTDPLEHALVTRSTANCSDITWLFDPAVFVDDDGTGYLCFGGGVPDGKTAMPGTSRIVKLGDDMISLAGTPVTIDAPYLFEDSGINKINGKYYYSYCSNWNTGGNSYGLTSGAIEYMVADSPLGPYTYGGELFKNQGNFFGLYGNNHHSIVELNGQLYLFYHARAVEAAMGITGNYRSPQVNAISVSGTKLNAVTGTMTGIAQLKKLDASETVQAETMSNQSKDITVTGLGDTVVNGVKGSWFKVTGVSCGNASSLTMRASSASGAVIKVCTGSASGTAVTYVEIPAGGSTQEITVPLKGLSGTTDLYFVYSASASIDSWRIF